MVMTQQWSLRGLAVWGLMLCMLTEVCPKLLWWAVRQVSND